MLVIRKNAIEEDDSSDLTLEKIEALIDAVIFEIICLTRSRVTPNALPISSSVSPLRYINAILCLRSSRVI